MKKINIKLFTAALTVVLIAGVAIIFYACKKEEIIKMDNPSDSGLLKSPTNEKYKEQLLIEAHNIIVDFLLKSKKALDANPAYFEQVCKNGNKEELINLIGYNSKKDIENSTRLFELAKEITALYELEKLPQNSGNCSSCTLESFPEILLALNYDPQDPGAEMRPPWDFLMCLHGCALECIFLVECPPAYAACVAACTAACYFLSTRAAVACS